MAVSKPHARTTQGEELALRTYRAFAGRELLTEAARRLNLKIERFVRQE